MRVEHRKLIRDLIPQIIEAGGHRPVTRVLGEDDYHGALLAKLVEEAAEVRDATAGGLPGELADVVEVITALLPALGLTWDDLFALADRKRTERGGFTERIYLEYVDHTP
ncbi:phosphoribosyl-ATP pyrophosphohydrolase [Actinomadura craniellae]|uniref:Phosphoribosyl-ATP pyrophosphohydrolase n=1 Tax=Actinomadura craniellae TaxID=2231787 RepID=A0A365GWT5_9ACTN|nr:nucleoside triphosphate pyrophosphohydrolase [Actinomadura craniellae]RAY11284.1 phosphoribosyl-ATP pyrophosphohydrolase [Actinomadura craniellae]